MITRTRRFESHGWYSRGGPDYDVVIATQAQLARNLTAHPFSIDLHADRRTAIRREVESALADLSEEWLVIDAAEAGADRLHLGASLQLCHGVSGPLLVSPGEEMAVILGGREHVAAQATVGGLDAEKAHAQAQGLDQTLEERLDYAVSMQHGYLMEEIDRSGTGLSFAVVLHLAALEQTAFTEDSSTVGEIEVERIPDDGDTSPFHLLRISAERGEEEAQTITRLEDQLGRLVHYEREAREVLATQHHDEVSEAARRAVGALMRARRVSERELRDVASVLRLAAAIGDDDLRGSEKIAAASRLWFTGDDYSVVLLSGSDDRSVEEQRADLCRSIIRETSLAQEL